MKPFVATALLTATLCLSGCATAPTVGQIDSALTNAQIVFDAAKQTVTADAQAGLIDSATAAKINSYITAGDLALSGAQQAFAAGDATTEQAKVTAILSAVTQINTAIITAVAAYSAK